MLAALALCKWKADIGIQGNGTGRQNAGTVYCWKFIGTRFMQMEGRMLAALVFYALNLITNTVKCFSSAAPPGLSILRIVTISLLYNYYTITI